MKVAVRYYSRTGNSEKLARAVGEALGIEVKDTQCPVDKDTNILFLCSAVYNGRISKEVENFLKDLELEDGQIVSISTAGRGPSSYKKIEKILRKKKIPLNEKEFFCKGEYKVHSRGLSSEINTGRPNEKDIKDVQDFVKMITEEEKREVRS